MHNNKSNQLEYKHFRKKNIQERKKCEIIELESNTSRPLNEPKNDTGLCLA